MILKIFINFAPDIVLLSMQKGFKMVWLLLVFGVLAVLPQAASAQISAKDLMRAQQRGEDMSSVYGSNPYQNSDEEGDEGLNPADTTKKEKRIRKPLESYFFNDSVRALHNFMWHVSKDFNRVKIEPLDTTLTDWRIDYPFYRKGVGDIAIGGLGQGSMPIDYFERERFFDFTFVQPYEAYTYDMESVPFYNVKKPYLHMTYLESGQKKFREEQFGLTVAHNISPSTGFNINYKARGTRGQYDRQRTKNRNLEVAFSHTGKRYSIHAAYIHNYIEQQENGGVVGEWAIRDTIYEMPSGVPMRLSGAEAQNTYRNNAFFVEQSFGIPLLPVTESDFSIAHLPAVYIGHSFEYNSWTKTYSDVFSTYTNERGSRDDKGNFVPTEHTYYENWYINPDRSRDSITERRISNRIFVQAQPWNRDGVVGTIDGGIGFDLYKYSQFAMESYLSGGYKRTSKSAMFVYGGVEGKIRRYVDWGANIKFYPSGYRGGDLFVGAHIALKGRIKNHPLILEGDFKLERRTPGFWQENLFSNHYVWFTPLSKETDTRFEVALKMPSLALEVGVKEGVVDQKIYYGPTSHIEQASGAVNLTSVYARKDFRIGGLHLDHRVLLQWSSDQEVVPVPLFSAFLSYYYEFWVVRNVLRLQFGVDCRYNTTYYGPGYNPALSTFYNQREVKTGGYPYTDVFLTGKWKRMRIFLKYQHLNKGLWGNGNYFSAAHYPLNPGMFKMGISWGFYD